MGETVRLAHLSDVHLPLPGGLPARYLNVKRTLGWLNWQRKRRFVHTREAVDALVTDMKAQALDHVLVSGDLVNIGLPDEYAAARDWLASVGPPEWVSVVPGNHDAYVAAEAGPGIALWAMYAASDEYGLRLGLSAGFPYVRKVGHVAIVGVNSGIATKPGSAVGEVGAVQRALLGDVLGQLGEASLVRVVMIHHPPVPGLADSSRRLLDDAALAEVLARCGAELVVHGHNHVMSSVRRGATAIEGVATASAVRAHGREPLARYNLISIERGQGQHTIQIETRGLLEAGGPVTRIAVRTLDGHTGASEIGNN
ncbi:MAG: metallophosphoesterase [Hyphomicrobiaceae bacterium]